MKIKIPSIQDERGILSSLERELPFAIKKVFYLHHISPGAQRGKHAHKKMQQFFIACHGSFAIELDNAKEKSTYILNDPAEGIYVAPMTWVTLSDFSQDAVCLVLTSDFYDIEDYIKNYEEFLRLVK